MARTGPNLYELLKQAGSKPPPEEPAPEAGHATTAAAAAETPASAVPSDKTEIGKAAEGKPPSPPTRVETPASAVPSTAGASEVKPGTPLHMRLAGLGERVLPVTYNTAAFVALGVVGALFLLYAIGVRVGRASPRESVPAASPQPAAPPIAERPAAPASPPPVYTIRLMEWNARTSRERTEGQALAYKYKSTLDRSQLAQGDVKIVGDKVVLNYGRFTDPNSSDARERLGKLRDFRMQRGQEALFRGAGFVRIE